MATTDVPGANPKNRDALDIGCWAEDDQDTSLLHVVGREHGQVIYQMYDLTNGMFYQDAMLEQDFKATFSHPPTGQSAERWTWHDKTTFPWDRVMKRIDRPVPQHADVMDQLTAAAHVAERLNIEGRRLDDDEVTPHVEQRRRRGYAIMDRIADAIGRFVE